MYSWIYSILSQYGIELQPEETSKPIKFNIHGNTKDGITYVNLYYSSNDRSKYLEGSVQLYDLADLEEVIIKWNLRYWLRDNEFLLRKSYSDDDEKNRRLVARKLVEYLKVDFDEESPDFLIHQPETGQVLIDNWVLEDRVSKLKAKGMTLHELIEATWFGKFYFGEEQLIDIPWYTNLEDNESEEEIDELDEENDGEDEEQQGILARILNKVKGN